MRAIFAFLAAAAMSGAAFAQQQPASEDHAAHHPEGASAPAARPKAPVAKPKPQTAKPKAAAAASGSMGMGKDMGKMHDEAQKPGGMHDQMHGKDGKMMGGGAMSAMPSASAASQ